MERIFLLNKFGSLEFEVDVEIAAQIKGRKRGRIEGDFKYKKFSLKKYWKSSTFNSSS